MTKLLEQVAVKSLVEHNGELIFSKERFAQAIVERILERIETEIDLAYEHSEPYASATLEAMAIEILDDFDMELPKDSI